MPTYEFRCDEHGLTAELHAMSAVPATSTCPACAQPTRRVISAPTLGRANSPVMRALDATKQTAESPGVVPSLPPGPRAPRPVSADPRHAKLPRP